MTGSYLDSTDAGWNSMLRNKPFVLDWMKDVAARAKTLGKRLVAFSHYPMIDPLGGTVADEGRLLGDTNFVRRTPGPAVAEAVVETGVAIHFSGHLHINDTAIFEKDGRFLANISVPSMVGFPPAYKIADVGQGTLRVRTVVMGDVENYDAAFGLYRAESALGATDSRDLLAANSHVDFLSRHLATMVRHRYLPREWPADLARLVPLLTLSDLWGIAASPKPLLPEAIGPGAHAAPPGAPAADLAFFEMVVDWYRLRKGRELALDHIAPERLAAYRALSRRYAQGTWQPGSLQARLASFLSILDSYLASKPSRDFTIDLNTGAVTALPASIAA